ncbi:LysR family transcriptional regulator [Pseudohoeflea suaedae]|uniref:LysR family transcriptional regulator n=1 Tax=Pseudohoeflea suaedae TaxID=877384 RepID=A0A4R5PQK5_9HYPH|nr:LysR family transcriptional regulator [Pseudohoeflea suaedae]TDH38917.1 LysR family transcriptional regulator [Pseudohoeflea suaedae]
MSQSDIGWELWRSFLAVMSERSLSGAARSLGVSQPTIGRHIDQLETALGVGLFTRAQNGLTPTDLATALEPQAQGMAASAAALSRTASAGANSEDGMVRVSATEIMSSEMLPLIFEPLLREHPGLQLEIDASNRTVDLLRRDADIAVRMQRPEQGALLARKLGVLRLGLFATRQYLGNRPLPDKPSDLAEHRIIGPDRDPIYRSRFSSTVPEISPEIFTYRSDSHTTQLAALRAGIGIGICQVWIAENQPDLVPVLPESVHFELEVWLTMHEDLRHSRRIKMVYDHIAACLPAYLT